MQPMFTTVIGIPLGTPELLIILVIVVMLFGVGKLPKVAKELGAGVRGFQKSLRGDEDDEDDKDEKKKKLDDDESKPD